MKKIILLIIILFLSALISYAQSSKIDSLKEVLKTAKEDTNKVIALTEFVRQIYFNNPDTAIILCTQAQQLSEKINWKIGTGMAYNFLGYIANMKGEKTISLEYFSKALAVWDETEKSNLYSESRILKLKAATLSNFGELYINQDDYSKALDCYFKALKIKEEIGDRQSQAGTLASISRAYNMKGDYPQSLDYSHKGLKIAEEFGDNLSMLRNLQAIGYNFIAEGNYSKALDYQKKALKKAIELGRSKTDIAMNLGSIGIVYDELADYPQALDYYFKALKIHEETGDKKGIATCFEDIGNVYFQQGNFAKSLDYYFKALKIGEELGDKLVQSFTLNSIGSIYKEEGDYLKSLDCYLKALKIGEELGNKNEISEYLDNIGSVYILQNKFKEADEYLQRGLKLATEIGSKSSMAFAYNSLGGLYFTMNNYPKAIAAYKNAIDIWRDELLVKDDPNYATALNSISETDRASGQYETALSYSRQSFCSTNSFLLHDINSLSEKEKSDFINTVTNRSGDFYSNAYLFKSSADSGFQWLYDYQLSQRGLILESSLGLTASLQQDSSLEELWDKLKGYRNMIGKENIKPADERRKDLIALEDSANEIEKILLAKSVPYRNWKERVNTTWQDVQKHLAKDEAAIEFISYELKRKEKTDSIMYTALLLTPSLRYPKMVSLFEEKQLSKLLQNVSAGDASGITNLYTAMRGIKVVNTSAGTGALQYGDSLYKLIWQPLMPYLKDVKTISYVPDGLINKISMAAIPAPNGKPLRRSVP